LTVDEIISQCLKAIGEDDPTAPVEMTRVECLTLINQLYRNDIAKRLKNLATYSYDASDAAHTITAGVGTLPSDYMTPSRVYDGDAPTNEPLTQIFDIEDKVAATDATSQYMVPSTTQIWIFGSTPTNMLKLYYYSKPDVLIDSSASSPTALKEEFHVDPFVVHIKETYAIRNNDLADMFDLKALKLDILKAIEEAHGIEKADSEPPYIKVEW
jgi:hypothetical protein